MLVLGLTLYRALQKNVQGSAAAGTLWRVMTRDGEYLPLPNVRTRANFSSIAAMYFRLTLHLSGSAALHLHSYLSVICLVNLANLLIFYVCGFSVGYRSLTYLRFQFGDVRPCLRFISTAYTDKNSTQIYTTGCLAWFTAQ